MKRVSENNETKKITVSFSGDHKRILNLKKQENLNM